MVTILDMPESPTELGGWLDRILMSDDLAKVVDELTVVHQSADEAISVEQARDWLGDSFSAVMASGLGAISQSRRRQLLLRPSLLPAMQELALINGGPYWNQLVSVVPAAEAASMAQHQPPPKRSSNRWLFAALPLAMAACIAAFVVIDLGRNQGGVKPPPHPDGTLLRGAGGNTDVGISGLDKPWGWTRTDVLDGINFPGDIPTRLADALSEWFNLANAAGSDIQALTLRVNELWAGCEHVSTQPLEGISADLQQRIRDVISHFQREIEAVLKELDDLPSSDADAKVVLAVRRSIDAKVAATADSLRSLK